MTGLYGSICELIVFHNFKNKRTGIDLQAGVFSQGPKSVPGLNDLRLESKVLYPAVCLAPVPEEPAHTAKDHEEKQHIRTQLPLQLPHSIIPIASIMASVVPDGRRTSTHINPPLCSC